MSVQIALNLLQMIEKFHKPMWGEGYPDDTTKYCSVCVDPRHGNSRVWPCRTVRLAKSAQRELETVKKQKSKQPKGAE